MSRHPLCRPSWAPCRRTLVGLVAIVTCLLASTSFAADPTALEKKVDALSQEIELLKQEIQQLKAAQSATNTAPTAALRSPDFNMAMPSDEDWSFRTTRIRTHACGCASARFRPFPTNYRCIR